MIYEKATTEKSGLQVSPTPILISEMKVEESLSECLITLPSPVKRNDLHLGPSNSD